MKTNCITKKILLSSVLFFLAVFGFSKSAYYYYDTRTIPSGLSLMGLNNKPYYGRIDILFPTNNLPDGFLVYKQVQTPSGPSWSIYAYDVYLGGWSIDPSDTNAFLNHGEGFYVENPSLPFDLVFVGEVVPQSETSLIKGYNLISSKTCKSGGITSVHGLSPNEGDTVYKLVNGSWSIYTFEDGDVPSWQPSEPIIGPFDGFFYNAQVPFKWYQNESIPNVYNSTERRSIGAMQIKEAFSPWIASIYCFNTKLNTESMITFSYSSSLTNSTWYTFSSYGPGNQPNDENYTGFWAVQPFYRSGYIRTSTW